MTMNTPFEPLPPLDRRHFLRHTAAAAAIPVLGSCAAVGAGAADGLPTATLRVGLVGCGGRGTGAAYNAVMADDNAVLVACADTFPDKIESSLAALEEWLGPREADPETGAEARTDRRSRLQVEPERCYTGFDAHEQLLKSGVDVVILATPPVFRPGHLRAAVEAGVHIFCEKPVAVDAPGVREVLEIVERAREKRLALVSGLCWRYNVRHRALFEKLADGAIGDVQAFYSTYNSTPLPYYERDPGWSDMEYQVRNWKSYQWLCGDHITEQAIHSLDKQAWAFGDEPPLSVTAVGGQQARTSGNIFDHFSATFEYANGAKAFHMCRQMDGCSTDNSDYVYGSQGNAVIQGWTPLHQITGKVDWTYEGEGNEMYQAEHDALFASIRKGEPINDGVYMSRSTMLAVMARMAAYTGQTLTWEQALASEERFGLEHYSMDAVVALREVPVPGRTPFV